MPTEDSLTHSNTGIDIDATVLYADIDGSTGMVDAMTNMMAAELQSLPGVLGQAHQG